MKFYRLVIMLVMNGVLVFNIPFSAAAASFQAQVSGSSMTETKEIEETKETKETGE